MLGFFRGLSDVALVALRAFSREMFPSMVTARQGRSRRSRLGMVRWLFGNELHGHTTEDKTCAGSDI